MPVFLHAKTYHNQVIVKNCVYKMIWLEMAMFFIRRFLMMENLIIQVLYLILAQSIMRLG